MNEKISSLIKQIEVVTDGMIQIPANEQHIAHIQLAIYDALTEIRKCLELVAEERKGSCE